MGKDGRLTSPVGVAVFPHLHAPDTKFNKDGVFQTKMAFDPESDPAAAKFQKYLDDQHEASREAAIEELIESGKVKGKSKKAKRKKAEKKVEGGHVPYTMELDDESGEETGRFVVNFKTAASGIREDGSRWKKRLRMFDASGTPLPEGLKVGSGSKLKISFTPNPWYSAALGAGFSMYLEAVQVIELETWDGPSADSYGFEEEEGFSADDVEEDAFSSDFDDDDDDDDWDDEDEEYDDDADF